MQKILIFQQNKKGESKIAGIKKHGAGLFEVNSIDIPSGLPPVIDDSSEFLPKSINADIVLDYIKHPDLSFDLALLCKKFNIPVIASGKKHKGDNLHTPPTCCGLAGHKRFGEYGKKFGAPEFSVKVENGILTEIDVIKGGPCGSTWKAAKKVLGMKADEACVRIGLEIQFVCGADPAGWDPIYGKSPVHFAGKIHSKALKSALGRKAEKYML